MSESKFVTAVQCSTGYVGAPILRSPHTKLSVTGSNSLSVLVTGAVNADAAKALTMEIEKLGEGWTDLIIHDYETVAEAWSEARLAEFRNLPVYTLGQWVNEHYGQAIDIAVMTRRDDLVAGDVYLSSYFGKTEVVSVASRGLTTTISGGLLYQVEASDRSGLVPVFRSPFGYEQHRYEELMAAIGR